MMPADEPVLLVVDPGYEKRYYYSATQGARGLGYLNWEKKTGKVLVYRLDEEATDTLNLTLFQTNPKHDETTGKWLKDTFREFVAILRNCTGIKEK